MAYLTLGPWLPVWPFLGLSTEIVFVAGTLAGIPIVYYVIRLGASVVRGRWQAVLALLGLTLAVALATAGAWLWFDRKSMAPIEHYEWNGWYVALLPGAYVAAILWGLGHAAVGSYRMVRRAPRRVPNRSAPALSAPT